MLVPELIPVTIPDVPTVATPAAVLLQVPPVVASVSDVAAPPAHIIAVPVTDAGGRGNGFTVTTTVAAALPQVLVIV